MFTWSLQGDAAAMGPIRHCRPALMLTMSLALVQGCQTANPELHSDYDPAIDFSKYQTFKFVQLPSTSTLGFPEFVTEQLLSSIANQMSLRGYERVQFYPDLLINVSARPYQWDKRAGPFPYYDYRYYGTWPGYTLKDAYTLDYEPGTLNIDLIDAARMHMVWEGRGSQLLEGRPPRTRSMQYDTALRQAVQQIFDRYPFRAGDAQPVHAALN
jgi:hypothetical protein